ncbi:nucleotidyl transferase AbiEii/AbiGii toxin family protein, partial [Acinetobacter baumannii]
VGGTALRILHQLNRFSEDLNFCLIDKHDYHFSDSLIITQTL